MFAIGLTGGIGSGKSQVADWLAEFGASIIDTDVIAHQLTGAKGAAMAAIQEIFGVQAVLADGSLDRNWMRERVFNDDSQRQLLQNILHPLIGKTAFAQAAQATGQYCVFVVPLLVESGRWQKLVDRICVVDCDPDTQIQRVMQRNGLTVDTIRRIMSTQATRQSRLAVANDVIVNDSATTLVDLRKQTYALHQYWCSLITGD